ncbi:efflux RND transporter permease subunit [Pararobbsia silviterrae]|uniref:Efflux RND transporter permease subunit n=1 Tax=Pararobbsia silviterrae TaxID=1792498 RepID=A0A494XML0_9BURK|nr:efflux RND transporter permease subunit [Pararobbsia silviterrae]RKP51945.1 efflux RND transporter permease subunit [Pararobbsia silviterrae]
MLKIVRLALVRPYTFIVLALLILLAGPLAALRTPTDIFPDIKIPVISVIWTYNGLSPDDMAGRIIFSYERTLSSTVNDIKSIQSTSLPGFGIVKIFFQPNVDIRTATAQVTSISQTVLKSYPAGITPPLIINYSASTVPIMQLTLSSKTVGESRLFDYANSFIRPKLASIAGASIAQPYGGKVREVQVDVDPQALRSKGLSPQDVDDALASGNQITPVGTEKIGPDEYEVKLNNSPDVIDALNDLPIKTIDGTPVLIRDVAHVRDGYPPQTNVVRVDGGRSVLLTVLKSGSASTLDIVNGVRDMLPEIRKTLPPGMELNVITDQSVFVKGAISGVAREGVIAAALTSLMILLFLASWRSTLIITASIPLAVLASITALSALGETLNIMTLGGLALAVGILVDDATVTIENINWHLEQGKGVEQAIMDGAKQIVGPAFVSLLCICIVFVPMLLLDGVARYLFVPMAEAVIFAMIASFILSRTLVPTLAKYLLRPHQAGTAHASTELEMMMQPHGAHDGQGHQGGHDAHGAHGAEHADTLPPTRNPFKLFQRGFERRFSAIRAGYRQILIRALERRGVFIAGFLGVTLLSFALVPTLGRNFFPDVDAGQIAIHVRAPVGMRIEDTAALFDRIEQKIRDTIPPNDLSTMVDNLGLPVSGLNIAYNNTGTIGEQDGDLLVSLDEHHAPTAGYVKQLRAVLPQAFPGVTFAFLPADITSQILNFGSPAPIDLQVRGRNLQTDAAYATRLLRQVREIPGVADARIQQSLQRPQLRVDVDRTRASELGITERDVTNALTVALAGSSQVAPSYWLNPRNGVSYAISAQTPQYSIDNISDLEDLPVTGAAGRPPQILGALATISRHRSDAVVSHESIEPVIDIYATTQGRDLGGVASAINRIVKANADNAPTGVSVHLEGQVQTMNTAFAGLLFGLVGAIVLIYLLIVVNFHSWLDPFVIITALPTALAGIVWMLFVTHTTLSVPALTGAIMCMGVATANSILVVSFARERLAATGNAMQAAVEAGFTRFRPVLMTALAMIIGMAPMALGLGDGGEQNAPLGRAVIGGLLAATCATLLFVPVIFSLVHRRDGAHPTHSGEADGRSEA